MGPRYGGQAYTSAVEQFHTSSQYPKPASWTGAVWKIRNDYPVPLPGFSPSGGPASPLHDYLNHKRDAPWLGIDFRTNPMGYVKSVIDYCWEGNRAVDFVVQKNTTRDWYHAPWMHASIDGREPLRGLTFERPTPPLELASGQTHALQTWAIGFYNSLGASIFGYVWKDRSKPNWTQDLKFPEGTCVFKLLMSTALDEQVPTMKGSPTWPAVISPQPYPAVAPKTAVKRNAHASDVRLIQVDWAVVDSRAPIGWVFGTLMYDGTLSEDVPDPWNRLTAVGIQWGNDPKLDQAAYDKGKRPVESWINPRAEELRKQLGGTRPSWGYNGRLNGPADNFISACTSCHSTAQWRFAPMVQPGKLVDNKWVPQNEKLTMTWFENVPAGKPFSARGAISAGYSLQLMIGFDNYKNWLAAQPPVSNTVPIRLPGRRIVFRPQPRT